MQCNGFTHSSVGHDLLQLRNALVQGISSGCTTALHWNITRPLVVVQYMRSRSGHGVKKQREVVLSVPEMLPWTPVREGFESMKRQTYRL